MADVAIIMQSAGSSPMLEFLRLTDVFQGDADEEFGSLFNALVACLPGFVSLKSFHFIMYGHPCPARCVRYGFWSPFLEAIRKNSSLIDVVGLRSDAGYIVCDSVMLAKLDLYAERNRALARLIDDSNHSFLVRLGPSLARTVRRCEHGPLWIARILMALEQ